jgi:hypothetical protein
MVRVAFVNGDSAPARRHGSGYRPCHPARRPQALPTNQCPWLRTQRKAWRLLHLGIANAQSTTPEIVIKTNEEFAATRRADSQTSALVVEMAR